VWRATVTDLRPDRLSLELAEREQDESRAKPPALVGLVQVGMSEAKLRQALITVIGNFIVLTITMILAGVLGTLYLTRRMTNPLRDLAAGARTVAEGNLDSMVTPTSRDEIGQLAGLFNVMTRSLKERDQAISTNMHTIRRQIAQLTTLNQASAAITSTLDLDKLLTSVLRLLIDNLGFARMVLVLYDPEQKTARVSRVAGVPEEIEQTARQLEIPVTDDGSINAELLIRGKPLLILDLLQQAHRVYPPLLVLMQQVKVTSFVAGPLRSQQRILGYLAGDRGTTPCTMEDLDLLMTVASHVAVAIDNARAYLELERLTKTLERRVEERTQELKTANLRLQEHDRRRSKFLSVASHELRTPMTSIRGLVENMLDGLTGGLTDRQGYYLRRVDHNIERLTRMVNQLLDWSRLDMGRIELKTTPVDLAELVREVLDGFQVLVAEKNLTVRFDQTPDVPSIQADRDKLEQVLWNLVGNAVKFTPSGGEIRVTIQQGDAGTVRFCVRDTGCGIAPEDLPHVFDEFSKVGSSLPQSQGAQLGLYITKSLIVLHGGRIEVESTPGAGSCFSVTLPIALSSPAVHSEQPAASSE
jgi:signal transduction histidine kinase/HAMP domain-containing protein